METFEVMGAPGIRGFSGGEVFCHRGTERHRGRTETNEEGGGDIAEGGGRLQNEGVLFFAFPMLLGVVPVIAVVGGWGILRAGRRTVTVSSTRLWAGLLSEGEVRRRRVDWVMVMLWMAAILGALAIAAPGWRHGNVDRPSARVEGSVRSTSQVTQLFLRLAAPQRLPGSVEVEVSGRDKPVSREMAVEELRRGAVLTLGDADEYTVTVRAGESVLGVLTFSKPVSAPFGLMTEVFAVQVGARVDDPTVRPVVLLVDSGELDVGKVAEDSLVVVSAETPVPGIRVEGMIKFAGDGEVPVAEELPGFVDLRHVRVKAMRAATLSAEWRTVVSVERHALVAVRQMSQKGPTICWVGAEISSGTTWGADPSFVMCFAEVLGEALPGGKDAREWTSTGKGGTEMRKEVPVDLTPAVGMGALGLIVAAMGMMVWGVVR
jgi:hypothetical protein